MSFILKNYPTLIRSIHQLESKTVGCLCMDSNSIIYDVYNRTKSEFSNKDSENLENQIIQRVIQKIEEYVSLLNLTQLLYIAFDGVAPMAKMEQQRLRRYKNWHSGTFFASSDAAVWNTSSITPGTKFMDLLSRRIKAYFEGASWKRGASIAKIIVSGSDEVGEGEQKIFKYIRSRDDLREIFVYGLDSDLIMLSLFHCSPERNIYVFREEIEFQKSKVVAASETPQELLFMDICGLSEAILQEMGVREPARIYDYLFLCFFLGNDFLPHFPSLNIRTHGIHLLLDLYKDVLGKYPNRSFISEGKIQWKWFKLFVEKLAQKEKQLILEEYSVRDKMDYYKWAQTTPEEKEYVLHNTPVIFRAEEKYICPQENMWEERYYKMLFHQERTRNSTREITTNLLEGFEWVFRYYTEDCPDWKWKYRFHYPPLLVDMVRFIPDSDKTFICPGPGGLRPFTPQLQLSFVLPPANHFLLGEKKAEYLQTFCGAWFPKEMKYRWAFCRYFFESHLELPEISIEDLEKVEKGLEK